MKHWRNVNVFLTLIYENKNNFIDWFSVANMMLFPCWKLNELNLCIEKRVRFKFLKTIDKYELKRWRNVYVILVLIYRSKNNFTDWFPVANMMFFQCCKLNIVNKCIEKRLGFKFLKTIDIYELKHWWNVNVFLALIYGSKNNFTDRFPVANMMLFQCCKLNIVNLCIEKRLGFKFLKPIDIYELKHWRNVNAFLALIFENKNNFTDWFPVAYMMVFQCCKLNIVNLCIEIRLGFKFLKTIGI